MKHIQLPKIKNTQHVQAPSKLDFVAPRVERFPEAPPKQTARRRVLDLNWLADIANTSSATDKRKTTPDLFIGFRVGTFQSPLFKRKQIPLYPWRKADAHAQPGATANKTRTIQT